MNQVELTPKRLFQITWAFTWRWSIVAIYCGIIFVFVSACAEGNENNFKLSFSKDPMFCSLIAENLNDSSNVNFASPFLVNNPEATWKDNTTEFFVKPEYQKQIKWVEWKPIDDDQARRYFKSQHLLEIINRTGLSEYNEQTSFSEAEIKFDSEGKYTNKVIRFQSHDIRYAIPVCYLPEIEKGIFSEEYINGLNEKGLQDCGLFYYKDNLYKSTFYSLAFRSVGIRHIQFDPVKQSLDAPGVCKISGQIENNQKK